MKVGFIGCGNMALAIIRGILNKNVVKEKNIFVTDIMETAVTKAKTELKVNSCENNKKLVENCDIIFLSVKPQYYESVLHEVAPWLTEFKLIITIAPGKTLQWIEDTIGKPCKLIRTMPNTPAMVGEGMTAVCPNENISKEELSEALCLLNSFGKAEIVDEKLMNAIVAVSGSSPAYIFIIIEAMADAAVAEGMPRNLAYQFASQSVLGSAKMVLSLDKHPGELKDMVCSPGGTTIDAVGVLEKRGLRSTIFEAIQCCADKAKKM